MAVRASALLLLLLCSCKHLPTIPAPPAHAAPPPPPVIQPSNINLPITASVPAEELQRLVDSAAPFVDYHASKDTYVAIGNNNIFAKYILWRTPIALEFQPNGVTASTKAYYWLELLKNKWIHLGECGMDEGPRTATVTLRTTISWRKDSWQLEPTSRFDEPILHDPCKLTLIGFDIRPFLKKRLEQELGDASRTINEKIAERANPQPVVARMWRTIAEPIRIGDRAWLEVNPEAAGTTPLLVNKAANTISTIVRLEARPRLTVGERPTTAPRALPPPANVAPGDTFTIDGRIDISYIEAAHELRKALQLPRVESLGKTIFGRPRTAILQDVRLYPAGEQLVFALQLSKPEGTLYLHATPVYENGTLKLRDVDFSLQTRELVPKALTWLLHEKLRTLLDTAANQIIADEFADEREKAQLRLEQAANTDVGDNAKLQTTIKEVAPSGSPYLTETSIVLPLRLAGRAQLYAKF